MKMAWTGSRYSDREVLPQKEQNGHTSIEYVQELSETCSDSFCDSRELNSTELLSQQESSYSTDDDGFEVYGVPLPQTIFNIVKNLVGEGLYTLPHALALGTGLVPALIVFVLVATLMTYTFSLVGRICVECPGEKTNEGISAWVKGRCFGKFVVAVITFKGCLSCVVLPMVLKDTVSTLLLAVNVDVGRTYALLMMTVFVLLPLCSLKDLSFLGNFSVIGILGELYAIVVIVLRWADSSYQEGGEYFESVKRRFHPKVRVSEHLWDFGPGSVVLVSSIAFCYMAHYNAPKFCKVMTEPSKRRWNLVTLVSYGSASAMYAVVMMLGYLTFGEHSQSFILDNYAQEDKLALGAHFAISISVLLCYPLIFMALRDGVFQLLEMPQSSMSFYMMTFALMLPTIGVALCFEDIGIMNALAGAMFATFITLVFPGLFVIFGGEKVVGNTFEIYLAYFLAFLGLGMAIVGTIKVLLTAFST